MISLFLIQVVPGSGRGWQLVELVGRLDGSAAELRALEPLDYEDKNQRLGLKFQVQVTDQVRILRYRKRNITH